VISRDVSENMPNFTKKITEGVLEIHGPHRRYLEVLCYSKLRNLSNGAFEISEQRIFTTYINTKSRLKTVKRHCSTKAIPVK